MKKNDYCMVKPLSGEEYAQISGGYAPPTAEQMREDFTRKLQTYMQQQLIMIRIHR